jgi:hypothetical protein
LEQRANVIESFTFAALVTNGRLHVFSVNKIAKTDMVNKSVPFHNHVYKLALQPVKFITISSISVNPLSQSIKNFPQKYSSPYRRCGEEPGVRYYGV